LQAQNTLFDAMATLFSGEYIKTETSKQRKLARLIIIQGWKFLQRFRFELNADGLQIPQTSSCFKPWTWAVLKLLLTKLAR
jgi:hypothetical protein